MRLTEGENKIPDRVWETIENAQKLGYNQVECDLTPEIAESLKRLGFIAFPPIGWTLYAVAWDRIITRPQA
jgi:hypothetical protein